MTNIKNLIKIYLKQMFSNYLSLGIKRVLVVQKKLQAFCFLF